MSFNPHTHAGCDYLLLKYLYYCQSFNPHTHAGCDPTKLSNGANEIVSIHTPTQGVTIGGLDQQIKSKVSIHTPTQGVTRIIWISIYLICFNPHTHAGCDRRTCNIGNSKAAVSIHTPTQGVTIVEWFTGVFDMFQSTHPRRVWQYSKISSWQQPLVSIHTPTQGVTTVQWDDLLSVVFQSTHPRRVWPWRIVERGSYGSFNPHTHAGCDTQALNKTDYPVSVSIHTPTQGVTRKLMSCRSYRVFQSTHPRRVWPAIPATFMTSVLCFNPHTHAGCD